MGSRVEPFSIATARVDNVSSATPTRAMSDESLAPRAQTVGQLPLMISHMPLTSLPHCPAEENHDNRVPESFRNEATGSTLSMQVSFLVHLKDPVELPPNVVDVDSD